ncbi:hypothetical protein GCM10023185_06420 [Hymenobacter saemangeumensis]|uniref:Lipoprotein leucine-zipper domain-containing protein n=1 Tax=Hymenobacter saemangeumensis TaxID=1084522 RepID=A0ABP8I1Q0_9BACT
MNNDQVNELLALMGQQIKEAAEYRVQSDRRFEQLTEVMVNGFLRLEDKLGARIDNVSARVDHLTERVDHLTERVDHLTEQVNYLTEEVKELKTDVQEIKTQAAETNRRLVGTFDQVGQLTEQTGATQLRLTHVEEAQHPTNAELDARLRAVENQLRNAS